VRNTLASVVVGISLSLAAAVACGGKIAGDGTSTGISGATDPSSGADPTTAASGSASPSPSSSFPPFSSPPPPSGLQQPSAGHTVDDACAAICERNGSCGAGQSDCQDHCTTEINGAVACSAQASTYIHCYADNLLDGCAALPPVCEDAYCAYTLCAGKVVPSYCHSR
jgi:hypothetical protein